MIDKKHSDALKSADAINKRVQEETKLLGELHFAMSKALAKAGLEDALTIIPKTFSHQDIEVDKYDGSSSLYLEWRNNQGQKIGHVSVHANHKLYAEFDIIRHHPTKKMWMIEAVEAWGSAGDIKAELRLMPALIAL